MSALYFTLPNKMVDVHLRLLRESDLKILLIIARVNSNVQGPQRIIHKRFSEISGMSMMTVVRSIQKLLACGLIKKYPEDSMQPQRYFLNMKTEAELREMGE